MSDFNLIDIAFKAVMIMIPLILSLTVHEFAHAWMAKRKGDNTAELMGRLTLNPGPHLDPIGTLALPFMAVAMGLNLLFGWAKPVPVNPRNLRDEKWDMFWIALAGPVSNLIQAIIGVFCIYLLYAFGVHLFETGTFKAIQEFVYTYIIMNVVLGFFNMLPLHPLDGGKIISPFISAKANQFLEENQSILNVGLLVLLISGLFGVLIQPFYAGATVLANIAASLGSMTSGI